VRWWGGCASLVCLVFGVLLVVIAVLGGHFATRRVHHTEADLLVLALALLGFAGIVAGPALSSTPTVMQHVVASGLAFILVAGGVKSVRRGM
jgi:hypothetical protein